VSEHSKEPWAVCTEAPNDYWYVGRSIESVPIGSRIADTCVLDANAKENARRIVACVNACAGIPNETLDSSMFRNAILLKSTYLDLQKERDELRTKLAQAEAALKVKDDALYDAIEMVGHVDNIKRLHTALCIQPSQEALDEYVMSRLEMDHFAGNDISRPLYRLKDK